MTQVVSTAWRNAWKKMIYCGHIVSPVVPNGLNPPKISSLDGILMSFQSKFQQIDLVSVSGNCKYANHAQKYQIVAGTSLTREFHEFYNLILAGFWRLAQLPPPVAIAVPCSKTFASNLLKYGWFRFCVTCGDRNHQPKHEKIQSRQNFKISHGYDWMSLDLVSVSLCVFASKLSDS